MMDVMFNFLTIYVPIYLFRTAPSSLIYSSLRNHSFIWWSQILLHSKLVNSQLHLMFHNSIGSLILVSTVLVHICIWWFTCAPADPQLYLLAVWHTIKIIVHLIAHSCIWWLTVASAYSTVAPGGLQLHLLMHRYIWSFIVVSDGSQLRLLIHCCICWLTTHLLIHRAPGGSQFYLVVHSCILWFTGCTSTCWSTVESEGI